MKHDCKLSFTPEQETHALGSKRGQRKSITKRKVAYVYLLWNE